MQSHGRVRVRPVRLAVLLAIGLTSFLIVVGCSANRMVFQPWSTMEANPAELKRPHEDIFFTAADGTRLNGWFFPANTNRVILVCHGNAGNLSHRLPLIDILLKADASVFAFDYRGYGRSAGKPTEKGVCQDAEAAWQWLTNRGFAATSIVALGESLGGGVVCELATRKPVRALILQSTFTSVPDLASEMMPWLPMRMLLTTRFNNREKLGRLRIPVLILHSRKDTIIPFRHAEKNYAALPTRSKYLWELHGDHNDAPIVSAEKYQHFVAAFLGMVKP
jgi:fermentation-respiration switch protein FrsA (DUF1100 family)